MTNEEINAKAKDNLVITVAICVPGVSDPNGEDADNILDEITLDLKGALEGWDWFIDDVCIVPLVEGTKKIERED